MIKVQQDKSGGIKPIKAQQNVPLFTTSPPTPKKDTKVKKRNQKEEKVEPREATQAW